MIAFTATATRTGGWWMVQCDQHPGAISQVKRLDQAAEIHAEAIEFVSQMDPAEFTVTVTPQLPEQVAADLAESRRLRHDAQAADIQASKLVRHAAHQLQAEGLTVRDIGAVLDVSYQRAHQLVSS